MSSVEDLEAGGSMSDLEQKLKEVLAQIITDSMPLNKHTYVAIDFNEAIAQIKSAIKNYCQEQVIAELTGLMQHHMSRNSVPPFTTLDIQVLKDRIKELRAGNAETNN